MRGSMRQAWLAAAATAGGAIAPAASAQSIYQRAPAAAEGAAPASGLAAWSMIVVEPPQPRRFAVHDLVTILIDESVTHKSEQKTETEKDVDVAGRVDAVLDPMELLEARLRAGLDTPVDLLKGRYKNEFSGEGKVERKDRFQARIQAAVIDVKPNGTLVLEAVKRKRIDDDAQTMVLSGVCRGEDVTSDNTILSSQLADLTLVVTNQGALKDAASKGIITRIIDTLFAF
jgi:flagellar L-ring protein precursor FlgH